MELDTVAPAAPAFTLPGQVIGARVAITGTAEPLAVVSLLDGAVEIVDHAIALLGEKGHRLQPSEQARLVSNLLVVICGESHVQPTVSMQSGEPRDAPADDRTRALLETIAKNTTPKPS